MKGFGADSRDNGHSRVPAPPESMIGTSGTERILARYQRSRRYELYPNTAFVLTDGRRIDTVSATPEFDSAPLVKAFDGIIGNR
ncbi:MAG TPA: hypothetical protein VGT79_08405 [Xanthomonadaceae bacterium]|nr:hypothetical protein [Xanthomonadaceae bacterium]